MFISFLYIVIHSVYKEKEYLGHNISYCSHLMWILHPPPTSSNAKTIYYASTEHWPSFSPQVERNWDSPFVNKKIFTAMGLTLETTEMHAKQEDIWNTVLHSRHILELLSLWKFSMKSISPCCLVFTGQKWYTREDIAFVVEFKFPK